MEKVPKEIMDKYAAMKDYKPVREGIFLGNEEEKFYVAKSEEEIYELSALAYYVWLLCDGEHTVEQMADKMTKDIQVELSEVIEPLVLSLESLSNVGLVALNASAK